MWAQLKKDKTILLKILLQIAIIACHKLYYSMIWEVACFCLFPTMQFAQSAEPHEENEACKTFIGSVLWLRRKFHSHKNGKTGLSQRSVWSDVQSVCEITASGMSVRKKEQGKQIQQYRQLQYLVYSIQLTVPCNLETFGARNGPSVHNCPMWLFLSVVCLDCGILLFFFELM